VGLVLLIACANVASLLLGRGEVRAKELAIRTAIGAGGGRIVRQLLTESLVLAMGAGVLGIALAGAGVRLLVGLAPADIPRIGESRIDAGVLLFALSAAVACSLLFGTVPAVRAARGEPQALLRGRSPGRGPAGDRLRGWLVLGEVALALTLLVGAGLLIRSAIYLERMPVGFVTADLLTARLSLPEAVYPRPADVERAFGEVAARLAHAPGVRTAAADSAAPLGAGGGSNGLLPEGKPMASENLIDSTLHIVTPGYFETLRLPLLAGRLFSASDTRSAGRVMIVSRELARQAWGDADPIGKRIGCCEMGAGAATLKTVVGLVGDVRSRGPAAPLTPEFYLPIGQVPPDAWNWTQRSMTLVARGPDPHLLAHAMRAAVRGVDAALPLSRMTSMDEALQGSLAEARFHTLLLLSLGLLGLLLAAVGIYGVIAYFVSSRTQEIGIRMALGATRERILSLLGRQAAAPLAGGLLVGTGGALAATRLLAGSLHGVTATDPATFTCVVLLLLAVGLLAVLIPAARATRVDPTRAIQAP
jgi:putative ABC transport system permease protein